MNRFLINKNIFKTGSVTYYYSSLFFSGSVKEDVFTLYAYVRVVDDLVDKKIPNIKKFEQVWKETIRSWNGDLVKDRLVEDFVKLARRRKFDWKWIEAFWDAMRQDLEKREYKNFKEVEKYMFGSAEVIGLMMMKILDLPVESESFARMQGKAMQWVNFVRDVSEDLSFGRVYMPKDELYKFKIDLNKLEGKNWDKFVRRQIHKYELIQKEAEKGYRYIPAKYLIPIKTAAQMYNWTAEKIKSDPCIVFRKKLKPSPLRVLLRLVANIISTR